MKYIVEHESGDNKWIWLGEPLYSSGGVSPGEVEYDTVEQAHLEMEKRISIQPNWAVRHRYRVVSRGQQSGLPTDDKERKALPIFRGPLMYFPDALLEVARLCKIGNDQHNPGQPMHWSRGKSTEQLDTAVRHMMDHGLGVTRDADGVFHMAKAAWRCLAELQLAIEKERAK